MAHVRCNDGAVVFDVDGVLLDTEPQYMRAILSAELGDNFPIDEFSRLWPVTWRGMVATEGIARKPGVIEILALLKEQALVHAIATLSVAEHAESSLWAAGLLEHFSVRVTGEQVSRSKPAPDIYLEAARHLDVPPSRCFAFEDSQPGLEAAASAGITAFMIADLNPASERSHATAHGVLDSLIDALPVVARLLISNAG